ncbi:MAG: response regulator [Desulfobulbaceae bacterium]|nr:response regulator [Desulfobulbaceae bacterium]
MTRVKNYALTTLLIEDDIFLQKAISDVLNSLGHKVYATCSGQNGQHIYQKHAEEIELVVTGSDLPEFDRKELFTFLDSIHCRYGVLILAHQHEEVEIFLSMPKCCGLLIKPFSLTDLGWHIAQIVWNKVYYPVWHNDFTPQIVSNQHN